jgi:outer membrane biosynthesis protein TonB
MMRLILTGLVTLALFAGAASLVAAADESEAGKKLLAEPAQKQQQPTQPENVPQELPKPSEEEQRPKEKGQQQEKGQKQPPKKSEKPPEDEPKSGPPEKEVPPQPPKTQPPTKPDVPGKGKPQSGSPRKEVPKDQPPNDGYKYRKVLVKRTVIYYEVRTEKYVKMVTSHDHCGNPHKVARVCYREVKVPVRKRVVVYVKWVKVGT